MTVEIQGGDQAFTEALGALLRGRYGAEISAAPADLCCVLPGCLPREVSARCVLLPGGEERLWSRRLRTGCAVTYGLSGRESLTFSSLLGRRRVLTVQRDIGVPGEKRVERQEILVPRGDPERTLVCAGLLLLLGERPETLERALEEDVMFRYLSE